MSRRRRRSCRATTRSRRVKAAKAARQQRAKGEARPRAVVDDADARPAHRRRPEGQGRGHHLGARRLACPGGGVAAGRRHRRSRSQAGVVGRRCGQDARGTIAPAVTSCACVAAKRRCSSSSRQHSHVASEQPRRVSVTFSVTGTRLAFVRREEDSMRCTGWLLAAVVMVTPAFARANATLDKPHEVLGARRVARRRRDATPRRRSRCAKRCVSIPTLAEAHYNLAIALRNEGTLRRAIAEYHRALDGFSTEPDRAKALYGIGMAREARGDKGAWDEYLAFARPLRNEQAAVRIAAGSPRRNQRRQGPRLVSESIALVARAGGHRCSPSRRRKPSQSPLRGVLLQRGRYCRAARDASPIRRRYGPHRRPPSNRILPATLFDMSGT